MTDFLTYLFFIGLFIALVAGFLGIDYFKDYISSKIHILTKRRIGFISLSLLVIGLTITGLCYFLQTPNLSLYKVETIEENGLFKATIFLKVSTNEPLGILYFKIQLDEKTEQKILDFWPASSAFTASPESRAIATDRKSATLRFSVVGNVSPVVEVTLTGKTGFTLTGNYGLNEYIDLRK